MKRTKAIEATAYHEAGHAVLCWKERVRLKGASIIPDRTSAGRIAHSHPLKGINPEFDTSTHSRVRMEKEVRILLAGTIAQRKFSPKGYRHYHGGQDHEWATDLLMHYTGSDEEVEAYINLLHVQTRQALDLPWVWTAVIAVAEALLDKGELTGRETRAIIEQAVKQ